MGQVAFVGDLAGDPGDVVVAHEGVGHERVQELVVPAECMVQLVQVPVGDRVPDALPQLVLGDSVQAAVTDEAGIVPVQHLTEHIHLRMALADAGKDRGPELDRHRIGSIEAPRVHAPVAPVGHHLGDQIGYCTRLMVQRGQAAMPLEGDQAAVGRLCEQVGLGAGGIFASRAQRRKVRAHVVEHAVQQHVDATAVRGLDQLDEVVLGAQAGVDAEVVDRVVAMG